MNIQLFNTESFVDLSSLLGGLSAVWSIKDSPNKMTDAIRQYYSIEEENKYEVLGIYILKW